MKLLALLTAIVMFFAFLGDQGEKRESSEVICGRPTSSHITATGVEWAEGAGRFIKDTLDHGTPESLIEDAVDGMYRVLAIWVSSFFIGLNGWKLPPEIMRIKQEAAQAEADANNACTPCPPTPADQGSPPGPPVDSITPASLSNQRSAWSAEQLRIMAEAIGIRKALGLDDRADIIIGITGLVESEIRNLSWGDRDSIGWLQQRPSQGWGTPDQLSSTAYQTRKFFEVMVQVRGWKTRPYGDVAQAVQRSAFGDKYGKRVADARRLIADLGEVPEVETPRGEREAPPEAPVMCASSTENGDDTGAGIIDTRIVWPVPGHATSTYPNHDGVDINGSAGDGNGDLGDPIKAAATGTVTHAGGGRGYGEAIFIQTDTGYRTVYGHTSKIVVRTGERVEAGQLIGEVGSTGNSSAAHLHFGVFPGGTTKAALDFLAGRLPNLRAGTSAAVMVGARRVKDPTTGAVFSIAIPAGPRGKAISFAIDQLGEPYVYNSQGPDSWDCSGLTSKAWAAAGVKITPQSEANEREIPHVRNPQPGDLLWQLGHIQMYVGRVGGETIVIEAPRPGKTVRITRQWMKPDAVLDPTKLGAPA